MRPLDMENFLKWEKNKEVIYRKIILPNRNKLSFKVNLSSGHCTTATNSVTEYSGPSALQALRNFNMICRSNGLIKRR